MTPLPRIVHLASGREWRGGQRQVLLLAQELARFGVDQLAITTRGSRLATELAQASVPTRAVGWRAGLSPSALVAAVVASRSGPTIIHAHDAHALTLAGLASVVTGARFVVTRRVDFPLRRTGFWARASAVIAISEAVRRILIADGIDPGRISVVHSGIDIDGAAKVTAGAIRADLGLPTTGLLAVSVAALVAHKDHHTLLKAAALLRNRFPDLHWAIAGDGILRAELERQARELGIAAFIHFLGHVAEPRRLIAAATLFTLSSIEEGLGTSILDALALGIPVVATRAGGIPEMLEGGAGILTPPGDPAALAEGIAQVLQSQELRSDLAAKGRHAVAQFTDRGMATKVLQVYRSVS